jgi:hypothetical protein
MGFESHPNLGTSIATKSLQKIKMTNLQNITPDEF